MADSLQIFHDQPLEVPVYVNSGGGRWELRGAIQRHFFRRKDKKTAIIGTCLNMNMIQREVEQLGEGGGGMFKNVINLSGPAMRAYEVREIYHLLLGKESSVTTILQSLDADYYFTNPLPRRFLKSRLDICVSIMKFLKYINAITDSRCMLFLENIRTMIKYCCSSDIENIKKIIFHDSVQKTPSQREEMLFACVAPSNLPFRKHAHKASQYNTLLRSSRSSLENTANFIKTHTLAEIQEKFDFGLYDFDFFIEKITHRSDIDFHIFIPPYCAICWAVGSDNYFSSLELTNFGQYIGGLLCFLDRIESFPNIHLYAFDDVAKITGNTANYWDGDHYSLGVSRYILKSIKAGKHRITKANVLEYLRRMADVLVHFDPTPNLEHTVSFEGPLTEASEKAFSSFPPPTGPNPLEP